MDPGAGDLVGIAQDHARGPTGRDFARDPRFFPPPEQLADHGQRRDRLVARVPHVHVDIERFLTGEGPDRASDLEADGGPCGKGRPRGEQDEEGEAAVIGPAPGRR